MSDDKSKEAHCLLCKRLSISESESPWLVALLVDAEVVRLWCRVEHLERQLKEAKAQVPSGCTYRVNTSLMLDLNEQLDFGDFKDADAVVSLATSRLDRLETERDKLNEPLAALRLAMGFVGDAPGHEVIRRSAVRVRELTADNGKLVEAAVRLTDELAAIKTPAESEEGAAHIISSAALYELEGLLKIEGDCNADFILSEAASLIKQLQAENKRLSVATPTKYKVRVDLVERLRKLVAGVCSVGSVSSSDHVLDAAAVLILTLQAAGKEPAEVEREPRTAEHGS